MRPQPYTAAEIGHYPPDVQDILTRQRAEEIRMYDHWTQDYSHSARHESGHMVHYSKSGAIMGPGPIHSWFGLSYASWLTLPRVSLQEMPLDWQARFVALLEEAETHGLECPDGIEVMRRVGGRFKPLGEWNNYRHGNTAKAKSQDGE